MLLLRGEFILLFNNFIIPSYKWMKFFRGYEIFRTRYYTVFFRGKESYLLFYHASHRVFESNRSGVNPVCGRNGPEVYLLLFVGRLETVKRNGELWINPVTFVQFSIYLHLLSLEI